MDVLIRIGEVVIDKYVAGIGVNGGICKLRGRANCEYIRIIRSPPRTVAITGCIISAYVIKMMY